MNKFLCLLVLCTASNAFALIDSAGKDQTYGGSGNWKLESGVQGAHQIKIKSKKLNEKSFEMTFEATESHGTDRYTWVSNSTGNGFFDIKMDGKTVGNGYCYTNQCHYKFSYLNGAFEETLMFDKDRLTRLGSKTVGEGKRIVWNDTLSKK